MIYINETKPLKNTPIEYLNKTLKSKYKGSDNEYEKTFNLKKSSLDLTTYTHFENFYYYSFDCHIFYNKEILTLVFFTGQDYSSDDYVANLFYHKTFKRKDIVNNIISKKDFSLVTNENTLNILNKAIENQNDFNDELGFDLNLGIKTKEGWWNSFTDEFEDSILFLQNQMYFAKISETTIEFSYGFRFYESRNKLKTDEFELKTSKLELNKYFSTYDYSLLDFFDPINGYTIIEELDVKKLHYIICDEITEEDKKLFIIDENQDEDEEIEEINFKIIKKNNDDIKFFNLDWDDKEELVYILKLKDDPKSVMSLNEELKFEDNIKIHLESCPYQRTSYQEFILLENGELYMNHKNTETDKNKLTKLDIDIENIIYMDDINNNTVIIKSDEFIYYIEEVVYGGKNDPKVIKFKYNKNGVPFFYQKKSNKKYDKYNYINIDFDENIDNIYSLKDFEYFDLVLEDNILISEGVNINYDNDITPFLSKKFKRNNPYDSFVLKNNFIIATSKNKYVYSLFVLDKKTNTFNKVDYFTEDEEVFRNVKQYFKLNNLPINIKYEKESYNYKITLEYEDYNVEFTNKTWKVDKK